MRYYHKNNRLNEVEQTLEAYRDYVVKNFRKEALDPDFKTSSERRRSEPEPGEKIRHEKHLMRRCRSQQMWIPALVQESDGRPEDVVTNPHLQEAYRRYEEALQQFKYLLERYKRSRALLQKKVHKAHSED